MEFVIVGIVVVVVIIAAALFFGRSSSGFAFPRDVAESIAEEERVVMRILVPRRSEKDVLSAEQMFAAFHGLLQEGEFNYLVSVELASMGEEGIFFYVTTHRSNFKFVRSQIYAQYPSAEIEEVRDYAFLSQQWGSESFVSVAEIQMARHFVLPLRNFRDFEVDTLSGVVSVIDGLQPDEYVWLQFVTRPVPSGWEDDSKQYVTSIRKGESITDQPKPAGSAFMSGLGSVFRVVFGIVDFLFSQPAAAEDTPTPKIELEPGKEVELQSILEKIKRPGFQVGIRVLTKSNDQSRAQNLMRDTLAVFKQYGKASLNYFVMKNPELLPHDMLQAYRERYLSWDDRTLLTVDEIATLFHLPSTLVENPAIVWSFSGKAPAPQDLPTQDAFLFAKTDFRGHSVNFGIKRDDMLRHFYLLGRTGSGKSTVMKNVVISMIQKGEGVGVIDPHGQLVEELLNYIPPERANDVVYFDPGDFEHPVGFNPLYLKTKQQRDLVADGIVAVFKKYFDSWGPRLEYILYNSILTCLESQGTTLLSIQRMLVDTKYRKRILSHVKDPVIIRFWRDEFAKMEQNPRLITETVSPIQNKIGRFLSPVVIRHIMGQVKSTIDIRDMMDNGKIFLANLAHGKIGEDNSSLLGGLLITRIQSAALERIDTPEGERKHFFLSVDEFQNFATDSFAKILSEARKYRLGLMITHQYIDQIDPVIRDAVFGNVGSLATFGVGQRDARVLAEEFAPVFAEEDLISLEHLHMYMKLMIDGKISRPFSAMSLPVTHPTYNLGAQIIQNSRDKYSIPRQEIEDKLAKWATSDS